MWSRHLEGHRETWRRINGQVNKQPSDIHWALKWFAAEEIYWQLVWWDLLRSELISEHISHRARIPWDTPHKKMAKETWETAPNSPLADSQYTLAYKRSRDISQKNLESCLTQHFPFWKQLTITYQTLELLCLELSAWGYLHSLSKADGKQVKIVVYMTYLFLSLS